MQCASLNTKTWLSWAAMKYRRKCFSLGRFLRRIHQFYVPHTKHTLGFETFLIKFSSYNSHTLAPFRFASEQLPGQEKEPTTSGNQRSPGKEPGEGRPPASCPPGGGRATTSTHPHPTSLLHGHRRRRAVNHLQNECQHQKQCRASRSIRLY